MATIGSATFARFEAQVALQYEFDVRDKGANFSTGYILIGATESEEYHPNITPYQFFHHPDAGGFQPLLAHLALVGVSGYRSRDC